MRFGGHFEVSPTLSLVLDEKLYAQKLNIARRRPEGGPAFVVAGIYSKPDFLDAHFSVSSAGAKSVGSSGHRSDLVVKALDGSAGDLSFRLKPVLGRIHPALTGLA